MARIRFAVVTAPIALEFLFIEQRGAAEFQSSRQIELAADPSLKYVSEDSPFTRSER